jgi:hypothetical protein
MEEPKQSILDEFLVIGTDDEFEYLGDPSLDKVGGLDQLQNQIRKE